MENQSFLSMFTRHEVLGEGAFAVVHRATNQKNHKSYAVKDVSEQSEELQNEIQKLNFLSACPYIVHLHSVYYEGKHSYLVMKEMKGGDLLTRITEKECYSEVEARQVCRYLLKAIDYCHQFKVAHRDLKPENLLLAEKDNDVKIKLSDFGLAAFVEQPNSLRTLCGTTEYTAPEVFAGHGYDQRADMWSVGVILYVLLGGYAPFDGPLEELLYVIQHGVYKFHDEYWGKISTPAKDMITSLLNVDPSKRMTAREALNCDWMTNNKKKEDKKSSIRHLIRNYERSTTGKMNHSGSTSSLILLDALTNTSSSQSSQRLDLDKFSGSSSNLLCDSLTNSSRRSRSSFLLPVGVRHQR